MLSSYSGIDILADDDILREQSQFYGKNLCLRVDPVPDVNFQVRHAMQVYRQLGELHETDKCKPFLATIFRFCCFPR
jgi:hypothetical protein